MPPALGLVLVSIAIVATVAAVALLLARRAWDGETARRVRALHAAAAPVPPPAAGENAALPPPVARYLAWALPDDGRELAAVHITWSGAMSLGPGKPWMPYTAEQAYTLAPPGFVWDATMRFLPGVPFRIRDRLVAGDAGMFGTVGGLVPVVRAEGTAAIAESALVRWLGETFWFPTILRPRPGLAWEAIDDRSARVTVHDGIRSATAVIEFAPGGEPRRFTALRHRHVGDHDEPTPFEGVYGEWTREQGVMIPRTAEVAWLLPEGRWAYWRGRVEAMDWRRSPAVSSGDRAPLVRTDVTPR